MASAIEFDTGRVADRAEWSAWIVDDEPSHGGEVARDYRGPGGEALEQLVRGGEDVVARHPRFGIAPTSALATHSRSTDGATGSST